MRTLFSQVDFVFLSDLFIKGGTTMFPGFPTRLENEIVAMYKSVIQKGLDVEIPFDIEVKVIDNFVKNLICVRIHQEESIMCLLEEVYMQIQ